MAVNIGEAAGGELLPDLLEGHLYQREYLGDVGEGADLQQGERLEEAAGADHHKQLGEEVEVCLEVRVSTEDSRIFHNHGEGPY